MPWPVLWQYAFVHEPPDTLKLYVKLVPGPGTRSYCLFTWLTFDAIVVPSAVVAEWQVSQVFPLCAAWLFAFGNPLG
jgi:hypothetical protein